jgi:exosortase
MAPDRYRLLRWAVPGALWFWLFYHLHDEWMLNERYNYGWAVPFLALFLFVLRWRTRPEPGKTPTSRFLIVASGWLLLALLLPIRVVEEANPDWRLLSWILAGVVVAFSLLSLAQLGGRSWLLHFAFPVCFPLVAVPWPVQFENSVVQMMTRAVAYTAVEIAGWAGIGAHQLGNVIQLRNGFVGVDEACSGVKTLQAGIMVALVLGELLRVPRWRRLALILLGCGWIFVCNVFRATTLVIVAANSGLEALARWHDLIGTAALFCGMAGLLFLAWVWKTDSAPEQGASRIPTGSGTAPAQLIPLVWLALVFGASELWYRCHERQLLERPPWQARWPTANETTRQMPIPETTRVILHYDDASSAAWEDPAGVRWWSFFARWKPQRAALQLVRSHSPEICLPAIGRTFLVERPRLTVTARPMPLEFRAYEFEQQGRPLFVFVCIQEDRLAASSATQAEEWSIRGRVLAAIHGKRNLGQRLLEIAVTGLDDFGRAKELVTKTVSQIVEPEKPTG